MLCLYQVKPELDANRVYQGYWDTLKQKLSWIPRLPSQLIDERKEDDKTYLMISF